MGISRRVSKYSSLDTIYVRTAVYYRSGYSDVVGRMVEDCMNKGISEVKALSSYAANGEVPTMIF